MLRKYPFFFLRQKLFLHCFLTETIGANKFRVYDGGQTPVDCDHFLPGFREDTFISAANTWIGTHMIKLTKLPKYKVALRREKILIVIS